MEKKTRLGLMLSIDLEAYDYRDFTKPHIRTTENTIISRIPPRVRIRKDAPLELTHVMLLANDPEKTHLKKSF